VYDTDEIRGFVLRLAVSLDVNIFEIFKIAAAGELQINTTGSYVMGVPAESFRLELNGQIKILEVLTFDAGITIQVGAGTFNVGSGVTAATLDLDVGDWYFDFHANMDFFGLATMNAGGWLNSKGHFNLAISGELVLGSRSFGLVGNFNFHIWLTEDPVTYIYSFGVTASASVSLRAFGITFASVGLGFSLTAEGAGRVPLIARASASIRILFVKISVSMKFTLGYIELPKPV
jgi:hypothetical protein